MKRHTRDTIIAEINKQLRGGAANQCRRHADVAATHVGRPRVLGTEV